MTQTVTVAIPTRNRSHWVTRAVRSALAQDVPGLSVLVSDNDSSDDTMEALAGIRDERLRSIRQPRNLGHVGNFRWLMNQATTDFLIYLGDDDEMDPGFLHSTVPQFEKYPDAGTVSTDCRIVSDDGQVLVERSEVIPTKWEILHETSSVALRRAMRRGWLACFSGTVFRTPALRQAGGLRQQDQPIDDFALLLRVWRDSSAVYVNRPLVAIRTHVRAASYGMGSFTPTGYQESPEAPYLFHRARRAFLMSAGLPRQQSVTLAHTADAALSADLVRLAGSGQGVPAAFAEWARQIHHDPRSAFHGATLRAVGGTLRRARQSHDARRRHAHSVDRS